MSPTLPLVRRESTDSALREAAAALTGNALGWRRSGGARLVAEVARAVVDPDESASYLLLSCLNRQVPSEREIVDFTRAWRVDGLEKTLATAYSHVSLRATEAVVVESGILIDVTDTGRSRFTTGIQRVARETLTRWARDHELTLASWSTGMTHLRGAGDDEIERVILDPAVRGNVLRRPGVVLVPFGATFVLPEIAVARGRADHLRVIARYSRSRATAIGFDCIPITTSETSGPGMPGAFSKYLAALGAFRSIATISSAATTEYEGWRRMLGGAGLPGPAVTTMPLPSQTERMSPETVAATAERLGLGDAPVVLAVGSHEPRKNHLNLLTASELAWREGREFTLVLVGGNAWGDDEFQELVRSLRRKGRSILLLSGVDDETVWSLYGLARFTVFCSINEGFGLPVVESLAIGTPVLTSDFGSMRELGEGHGALVVDPHDPRRMAVSMGRMLDDDDLIVRLEAETESLPVPTWDDYAARLWAVTAD
ncbi:glycosyltransferase family 1 protein [Frondihabitans peucedani]|uniref:Glycosyl transferase family 1 domain-containing protein n=1 Tax=Frondihabitans peucedani TaxID=598626 RepID=A0ABP8DZH7_9MICO